MSFNPSIGDSEHDLLSEQDKSQKLKKLIENDEELMRKQNSQTQHAARIRKSSYENNIVFDSYNEAANHIAKENPLKQLVAKHQIFKNCLADVIQQNKQETIQWNIEQAITDTTQISEDKYYRIVTVSNPERAIALHTHETGDYIMSSNNYKRLNGIWKFESARQYEVVAKTNFKVKGRTSKFKLKNVFDDKLVMGADEKRIMKLYNKETRQDVNEIVWYFQNKKKGDPKFEIHSSAYQGLHLDPIYEIFFLGDKLDQFFLVEVSAQEVDEIRADLQEIFEKIKNDNIPHPVPNEGKLDEKNDEFNFDDFLCKEEEQAKEGFLEEIFHQFMPTKSDKRLKFLDDYNKHNDQISFNLLWKVQTDDGQQDKDIMIKTIYDDNSGCIKLAVDEVVKEQPEKAKLPEYLTTKPLMDPIIIIKDHRFTQEVREDNNFLFDPSLFNYKTRGNIIEFVVVRRADNQLTQPIKIGDLKELQYEDFEDDPLMRYVTFAQVELDLVTLQPKIISQQKSIDLMSLFDIKFETMQHFVLLPVLYLESPHQAHQYQGKAKVKNESYDDEKAVYVAYVSKIDLKYLNERIAVTFQFDGHENQFLRNNDNHSFSKPFKLCGSRINQKPYILQLPKEKIQEVKALRKYETERLIMLGHHGYKDDKNHFNLCRIMHMNEDNTYETVLHDHDNAALMEQITHDLNLHRLGSKHITHTQVRGDMVSKRHFSNHKIAFFQEFLKRSGIKSQKQLSSLMQNGLRFQVLDNMNDGTMIMAIGMQYHGKDIKNEDTWEFKNVIFRISKHSLNIDLKQSESWVYVPSHQTVVKQNLIGLSRKHASTKWFYNHHEMEGEVVIKSRLVKVKDINNIQEVNVFRHEFPDWLIVYDSKNKARIINRNQTSTNINMHDRSCVRFLNFAYAEDTRDAFPCIFYNTDPETGADQDHAFWLIDKYGQKIENTFIILKLYGTKDPGITYASEVEFNKADQYQKVPYFSQKFVVSAKYNSWLYYIFEIEVKYFSETKMHAMLVGVKLMFTKNFDFTYNYKERPYFIKDGDSGKVKIGGIAFKKLLMPNPCLKNVDKKNNDQFDYVNKFTCTRVRWQDNYNKDNIFVIETFLHDEWVRVGNLRQFQLIGDSQFDDQLRVQLLNNSVLQALNSQVFFFSKFINLFGVEPNELKDQEAYFRSIYIKYNKQFQALSIFNGSSMADLQIEINDGNISDNYKNLKLYVENFENITDTRLIQNIKSEKDTYVGAFLRSPLESLIQEWNSEEFDKIVLEKDLLQTSMVHFNFDMVSNLETLLNRITEDRQFEKIELFESFVYSLQESFMSPSYKRCQIMSVLRQALMEFQSHHKVTLRSIAEFFDEYQQQQIRYLNSFDDLIDLEDSDPYGYARLRISNDSYREKKFVHLSHTIYNNLSIKDLNEQSETLVSSNYKECCRGNNTKIKSYFVCFQDYNFSIAINQVFQARNVAELTNIDNRRALLLNNNQMALLTDQMFHMCRRSQIDFDDFLAVRDMINHQYENGAHRYLLVKFFLFLILYIIPMYMTLLGVDIVKDNASVLTVAMYTCIFAQVLFFGLELLANVGNLSSGNGCCKLIGFQNAFDLISIFLSLVYCSIRIRYAKEYQQITLKSAKAGGNASRELDYMKKNNLLEIFDVIPLMGCFVAFFSLFQMLFYLQTFDSFNRQIKLLTKGFADAMAFLSFFIIWMALFYMCFYQLGAMFDDGNNYELDEDEGYDRDHDPYLLIPQTGVYIFSIFRTAVGDLTPPAYEYWAERYQANDKTIAELYIYTIWIFWVMQVIVNVILMLNFLIAIVSDSFNYIMDNESITNCQGRLELNHEYFNELFFLSSNKKPIFGIVVAASVGQQQGEEAWGGVTKTIQKSIGKLQVNFQKQIFAVQNKIDWKMESQKKAIEEVKRGQKELLKEIKNLMNHD